MSDNNLNAVTFIGLLVFVLLMLFVWQMTDAYRERQVIELITPCVNKNPISECKDLFQTIVGNKK